MDSIAPYQFPLHYSLAHTGFSSMDMLFMDQFFSSAPQQTGVTAISTPTSTRTLSAQGFADCADQQHDSCQCGSVSFTHRSNPQSLNGFSPVALDLGYVRHEDAIRTHHTTDIKARKQVVIVRKLQQKTKMQG